MNTKMTIRGVRCSMFMPQLRLSADVLKALWEEIPNWTPTVINPNVDAKNGVFTAPNPWMLVSPDDKERLFISPQKVDYYWVKNLEFSEGEIKKIVDRSKSIFIKMLSIAPVPVSRLAFAPAYIVNLNDAEYKSFLSSQFCSRRFKDTDLNEANFTQAFFLEEQLAEHKVWMNYLSKFETQNVIVNEEGKNVLKPLYTLEFDINTREDNSTVFGVDDVAAFYDNAPRYGSEYLSFYVE